MSRRSVKHIGALPISPSQSSIFAFLHCWRINSFVSAALVFGLAFVCFCAEARAIVESETVERTGEYVVKLQEFNAAGKSATKLEILRRGKAVFVNYYSHAWIFSLDRQEMSFDRPANTHAVIRDLTGDGIPDLVIQTWNGGAYCCYSYEIYSLGRHFHRIWSHDAGCGHLKIDILKGGMARLGMEDASFVFDYPWTVESAPRPIVYYWWDGRKFVLDRDKMRKALDEKLIVRAGGKGVNVDIFQRAMIALIFSGRTKESLNLALSQKDLSSQSLPSLLASLRKSSNFYRILELNERKEFAGLERLGASFDHK